MCSTWKNFPSYSEEAECAEELIWGDVKLGRLPNFLYQDAPFSSQSLQFSNGIKMDAENLADADKYKGAFERTFQYFQERCQLHIHKLVGGKRVIPNACRSKSHRQQCKHEAPWTNRVSPSWMSAPLIICKGLAKMFKLRCSGVRNWLGQTLLFRNDEWVNGTIPGMCVAFSGSNSDVKPNDRLPITADTHESVCRKNV